MRGDEKISVKLVRSVSTEGKSVLIFSFENTKNVVECIGNKTLWLKMERVNHIISGYFSYDGTTWKLVGEPVEISKIDSYSDYSSFTGTRQGLYVRGTSDAWFDFYIYRNAYTPIIAECPANQFGTSISPGKDAIKSLDEIQNNDWALYAGVEFGNNEYKMKPDSLVITASCDTKGGVVEVWLDSLDSKNKIAKCLISPTGGLDTYKKFTAKALSRITGRHDVYLRFKGSGTEKLFLLKSFVFVNHEKTKRTTQ